MRRTKYNGHLEGNPTGNFAAECEMIFCKNFIEKFLWDIAEKQIENNVSANLGYYKGYMKSLKSTLRPSYLDAFIPNDPNGYPDFEKTTFSIRDYIVGNLSEKDHGKLVPKI